MQLTPKELDYLTQQGEVVGRGLESQHQVIALVNNGQLEQARELLTSSAIPTQQQVCSLLQQLYDSQAVIHEQQAEQESSTSRATLLNTLLLSALISFAIGGATVMMVLRQIGRIEEALFRANEQAAELYARMLTDGKEAQEGRA